MSAQTPLGNSELEIHTLQIIAIFSWKRRARWRDRPCQLASLPARPFESRPLTKFEPFADQFCFDRGL